ncbi:hypothetical protein AAY473_029501 [Plecturocebus cupreus]
MQDWAAGVGRSDGEAGRGGRNRTIQAFLPQTESLLTTALQVSSPNVHQILLLPCLTPDNRPGTVAHACNPSTLGTRVEMGFLHVGQAGLKLLTSGDPPASASQSAAIPGTFGDEEMLFEWAEITSPREQQPQDKSVRFLTWCRMLFSTLAVPSK